MASLTASTLVKGQIVVIQFDNIFVSWLKSLIIVQNQWQNSQIEYTLLMIWDISNREKKMRDMTQHIEITKKFLPKFDIFVDKSN